MAGRQLRVAVGHMCRAAGGDSDNGDESALLDRFARAGDETAFARLVRGHGPMVLGVCRRILGDRHAAEDAFQATFLTLAQQAGRIRAAGSLGAWLHRVAHRVSLHARQRHSQTRPEPLKIEPPSPDGDPCESAAASELAALIDAEIASLPRWQREAVVLCCLQGLSNEDAASVIGCAVGTVHSRLSRARAALAERLARHGVTVGVGSGAIFPVGAVSASLTESTIRLSLLVAAGRAAGDVPSTVAALSEEVIHAMNVSKWKSVAVLAICLGLSAAGLWGVRVSADTPEGSAGTPKSIVRTQTESGYLKAIDLEKRTVTISASQDTAVWMDLVSLTHDHFRNVAPVQGNDGHRYWTVGDYRNVALDLAGIRSAGISVYDANRVGGSATPANPSPLLWQRFYSGGQGMLRGIHYTPFTESTRRLAEKVEVILDGRPGKLDRIADHVSVTLTITDGLVTRIEATGEEFTGKQLRQFDGKAGKLTVSQHLGDPEATQEFAVRDGVSVTIDGRRSGSSELRPGMRMGMSLSASKPVEVIGIAAGGPDVDALLTSVNAGDRKLSAMLTAADVLMPNATVLEWAEVTIDDNPASLSELRPGMTVTLGLGARTDRNEIVRIRASE